MTNLDTSPTPYAHLQEDPSQGISSSSNPTIFSMIGSSSQRVQVPPAGFTLVPGPNGQLILQSYAVPGPTTVQVGQFNLNEFNDGWYVALKVWLVILMISSFGSALFWIIQGITWDEGIFSAMCIPQLYLFYRLLVEFQALTQKDLSKARRAFMLLSGLILISYIILVVAVISPRDAGALSGFFWIFFIIFDATVCWGAYKVKRVLESHSRVHQTGQILIP